MGAVGDDGARPNEVITRVWTASSRPVLCCSRSRDACGRCGPEIFESEQDGSDRGEQSTRANREASQAENYEAQGRYPYRRLRLGIDNLLSMRRRLLGADAEVFEEGAHADA